MYDYLVPGLQDAAADPVTISRLADLLTKLGSKDEGKRLASLGKASKA